MIYFQPNYFFSGKISIERFFEFSIDFKAKIF